MIAMRGKFAVAVVGMCLLAACGSGGITNESATFSPAPSTAVQPTSVPQVNSVPVTQASPGQVPDDGPTPTCTKPIQQAIDEGICPSPATPTGPGPLYVAWYVGGGRALLTAIGQDSTNIGSAASNADETALSTACIGLEVDVVKAQAYSPLPESATQTEWAAALTSYSDAASDCAAGIASQDSSLLSRSGDELTAGTSAVDVITARIKELNQ